MDNSRQGDDSKEPHARIGEIHHAGERPHHHIHRGRSHNHNRRVYPDQREEGQERVEGRSSSLLDFLQGKKTQLTKVRTKKSEEALKEMEREQNDPPTHLTFLPPAGLISWTNDKVLTRIEFASSRDLSSHLTANPSPPKTRLYTLRGLPQDYVQVFAKKFKIDIEILSSHANRDSDLLMAISGRHLRRGIKTFALNYVDLVQDPMELVKKFPNSGYKSQWLGKENDLMSVAERIELTDSNRDSWQDRALLCHLTLISIPNSNGDETMILLLDNSEWKYAWESNSRKRHRVTPLSEQFTNAVCREDDSVLTLENLHDHLVHLRVLTFADVALVLSEIAIRQWMDYLRLSQIRYYDIETTLRTLLISNIRMTWRLMSSFPGLKPQASNYEDDWAWLLAQSGQSIEIRTGNGPSRENLRRYLLENRRSRSRDDSRRPRYREEYSPRRRIDELPKVDLDETKQSLDRMTYLGGVLLPFSIVSGILSMGGKFTPGEEMFYVFWIVAVPLSIGVLVMIFLDIFRHYTIRHVDAEKKEKEERKRIREKLSTNSSHTGLDDIAMSNMEMNEWTRCSRKVLSRSRSPIRSEKGHYRFEPRARSKGMTRSELEREMVMNEKVGWRGAFENLVGIDPVKARLERFERERQG